MNHDIPPPEHPPPAPAEPEPEAEYAPAFYGLTGFVAQNQTVAMLAAFAVGVFVGVLMRR